MTKTQTHATIYWVNSPPGSRLRSGYAWRIMLQPGRIRIDRGQKRFGKVESARESLDAALGLIRVEIPEHQIKVILRPEPKKCPET